MPLASDSVKMEHVQILCAIEHVFELSHLVSVLVMIIGNKLDIPKSLIPSIEEECCDLALVCGTTWTDRTSKITELSKETADAVSAIRRSWLMKACEMQPNARSNSDIERAVKNAAFVAAGFLIWVEGQQRAYAMMDERRRKFKSVPLPDMG